MKDLEEVIIIEYLYFLLYVYLIYYLCFYLIEGKKYVDDF